MRLDKYLKLSRLIKRRTVANEAAGVGRVLLNGQPVKPARAVKAGDELTLHYGGRTLRVRVTETDEKIAKSGAVPLYTVLEEDA